MNKHYFIAIKIPKELAAAIIQERDKTNLHKTHKILPVAEDLAYHALLFRTCSRWYITANNSFAKSFRMGIV